MVLEAAYTTENKTDNMSLHCWRRKTKKKSISKDTAWSNCEHLMEKQKGAGPQISQGEPWAANLKRKLMGWRESRAELGC